MKTIAAGPDFKKIKVIATDMDGTLTTNGKFSSKLIAKLEQLESAGLKVIVVTGRSAGWGSFVASNFPVAGVVAEDGGVYFAAETPEDATYIKTPASNLRIKLHEAFIKLSEKHSLHITGDNAYRLTDFTFHLSNLTTEEIKSMEAYCLGEGLGFTYSTVHCHIMAEGQNKALGLQNILTSVGIQKSEVVTVGDSPNDVPLFNPTHFPLSVGVANIAQFEKVMSHVPLFKTVAAEGEGFCELADVILESKLL